ncbi:MAG TPA: Na+/H+ antiporter subunit E [Usitatibacter sp.]|jgi:multicomponent K+:H+ antiporter subunit E|nr:Na+/H+ antiporter subunit E [Usitatibacter sp.]
MSRLLPYPLFSLVLLATWLALDGSLAPSTVAAGAAVAVAGGAVFALLHPPGARVRRRVGTALALLALVFADIVRSNLAVARLVLWPRPGRVAGFVDVPLALTHPGGLAALACIVTATPGTSWAGYDAARGVLSIHILDLVDGPAWVAGFKARYERRLLEIFP